MAVIPLYLIMNSMQIQDKRMMKNMESNMTNCFGCRNYV